jgi:nucleoside-diphosphate-sugar epimerase
MKSKNNCYLFIKNNMKAKNYGRGYKSKVLITGISGFIASNLATRLLEDGYIVGGIYRKSPRPATNLNDLRGKVQLYEGDFREYSDMVEIIKDFQPDNVMHLGAATSVSYSFDHPLEIQMINHIGTVNIAEACRKECPELKRFVFASTMEVYGRQKAHPLTEDVMPHPHSPYAVAKYAAERYLFYLYKAFNFPVVVARGSNCYGRKNDTYFLTETVINQMLSNPKEVNLGNKTPVRSWIYIDDMCSFYQTLLETDNKKVLGEVINNGSYSGHGYSVGAWVKKIAKAMHYKGKINWGTREFRPGEIYYINTVNEKMRRLTGWKPLVSEDEGIKKCVAYWKEKHENGKT